MLNFTTININDKYKYNSYTSFFDFTICDYSFNVLYMWKDYYDVQLCFYNDALFVKLYAPEEKKQLFYLPICKSNLKENVLILEEYCKNNNMQLIFSCLEPFQKEMLSDIFPNKFVYENIIDNADYIYLKEDLKTLSGKSLKNKRNFVNHFKNEYLGRYTYEQLNDANAKEIINFIDEWKNQNIHEDLLTLNYEINAIKTLLDNKEILEAHGGIIKIDNEIIAFSLGTKMDNQMITHFEKGRYDIAGSYQMINFLFANHECEDVMYINREEDLGVPGIRKAKQSYNPEKMGYNYNAYLNYLEISKASDIYLDQVKNLWNSSFEDISFSHWYFENLYEKENTYLTTIDNKVVSMARIFDFKTSEGKNVRYLYGLATNSNFRNQGLMSKLISYIKSNNNILIPENEDLINFYEKLGFKKNILGYKKTFTKTNNYARIIELDVSYAEQINDLYNEIFPNNIIRDKDFYKNVFSEFEKCGGRVFGLIENNKLISYAFSFTDSKYISEIVSLNQQIEEIMISSILNYLNIEKIDCINKFEGQPIYYCYDGDVSLDLYVNLLYN